MIYSQNTGTVLTLKPFLYDKEMIMVVINCLPRNSYGTVALCSTCTLFTLAVLQCLLGIRLVVSSEDSVVRGFALGFAVGSGVWCPVLVKKKKNVRMAGLLHGSSSPVLVL